MSTTEDQELMARISDLAGKFTIPSCRINRHKAQQGGASHSAAHSQASHPYQPSRGSYRAAPYSRGAPRGRGRVPAYRNKTLVLNGQAQPTAPGESPANGHDTTGSWVSRTDRHLQLINSDVFEKEAHQRTQAMEQTRRQKQAHKDRMERKHVMNYLRQTDRGLHAVPGPSNTSPTASNTNYEVTVEGIRFHVIKQGSKLVRAPDNPSTASPRVAIIGGVKFHRTKNGNLVRHGVAKAHIMAGGVPKVNVPCRVFAWIGSCTKGPQCRYVHDPSKVAICRDWLLKGSCPNGEACDLAHDTAPERTPLCLHFAKGNCNNDSCSYVHAEHAQTDPVCGSFGRFGYCDKGAECPDRHVFECPDFSNSGVCKTRGCKLPHREKASMLRKAGMAHDDEDLSSDDDMGPGGSDDIDSDEVEEFIGGDDADEVDFTMQKDYIGF